MPLNKSRWERLLLRFLELSGVGRVMEDGTDEEEARAARMDEWVVWEGEGGREWGGVTYFFLISHLLRGAHTPSFCAQRTLRA